MSARRITIGLKPTDDEPDAAVPREPSKTALDADPVAEALELVGARTAGAKSVGPSAEAWVRQGGEVALGREATGDTKPTAPPAAALARLVNEAPSEPAAPSDVEPAETLAAPQAPAEEAATGIPASTVQKGSPAPGWIPALPALLISAALGAAVAVLSAIVIWPFFAPSVETRLAPVVDRIAKIEELVEKTASDVGELNNEVAQAIDAGNGLAARVGEEATRLAEIRGELDRNAARAVQTDVDPSLFAVAVAQMRWAFYAGRPFEAELVNVYGMVRNDVHFSGLMNELSAPARTGVPNVAVLRQQFRVYVAAAGLVIGGPKTYLEYGMSILDQYAGLSSQTYDVELGNVAATEADRRLMNGDVAGAVQALAGLDPALVAILQPWLNAARTYLRVESAITELSTAAVDGLRQTLEVPDAG
jgi:hypothetical protein